MTEKRTTRKKRPETKPSSDNCQPIAVSGRHRRQKSQPISFSEKALKEDILRDALALKIPSGTAEVIATQVAERTSKWIEKRGAVTIDDVWRRVALEAKKYSTDLAYVYQNRGKII